MVRQLLVMKMRMMVALVLIVVMRVLQTRMRRGRSD